MEEDNQGSYMDVGIPKSKLICEMDVCERPREKALSKGIDSLNDAELMAIIFATGVKGKSVLDLCNEILDNNMNHLSLVAKKTVDELVSVHRGIGCVKAITLLAVLKLGERASLDAARMQSMQTVTSPEIAVKLMRHRFQWLQHEEFWVMHINRAGYVIKEERISQGGTCATTVDVKLIMKSALSLLSSNLMLFHNHPSGSLRPSNEDDNLTRKIIDAANYFDIRVLDHIIIADQGFYSYRNEGKL